MLKNESFIIVGYYTKGTLYVDKAKAFIKSMKALNIPHHVQQVPNLGSWWKNTNYKPTFLKSMFKKFPDKDIVYVDVDAEFLRYPVLFEGLDCNVGVYVFDRSVYKKSVGGFEVLSGTIFLKNNVTVHAIVDLWEAECKRVPGVWDQKSLQKVLKDNYYTLPGEYCKIYDRMENITDPVIVHFQTSREVRIKKWKLN